MALQNSGAGMTGNVKGSRRLLNWIDSFLEYSDILPSPRMFRKWAAVGILAGAMEQKVWTKTSGLILYPNLYMILVGPPGVGKSAVLAQSERMLRSVQDLCIAPSSVTTASLVDSVHDAARKVLYPVFMQFNSLTVVASELGVFLPQYDPAYMNTLCKMFDGELYEERRRSTKSHIKIDKPQLTIIGGTTPSYLNSFLPDGAWDQGFTARTIFVYNGESVRPSLFGAEPNYKTLEKIYIDLLNDLNSIAALTGEVTWTEEAKAAISGFYESGMHPIPDHGKLSHYTPRRIMHLIKLCMIVSVSRSSTLVIEKEDYLTAKQLLLEAEAAMPDIFKSMGTSVDARAMEDAFYFVYQTALKDKKPVAEFRLVSFLKDKVPSHSVMKIVEIMVRSGWLKPTIVNGLVCYEPGQKG